MAVFRYIAIPAGAGGETVRGTVTADTPRQARDRLRSRGLSIRDLVRHTPGERRSVIGRYLASRQAHRTTAMLQELSTLLAADIPLLQALDTIGRQHEGRFQRAILLLRDHVAAGGGLADAMRQQPERFDELSRNIVEVGENAGTLDTALARLVAFRRRASGLKNKVGNALLYPAIVLGIGLCISVFLMTFVLPQVLEPLRASGATLPPATRAVQALSHLLVGYGWALLLGAGAGAAAVGAALRTDRGRRGWHRVLLRLPVLGDLLRKQAIARMAMVMATLLKSDLTFVHAVRIAQRTVRNRVLVDALAACERAVYAGRDISAALEKTDAFPPLVVQVFAVGQASGRLETMLENLATDYDTQVDLVSTRLTALLEPILMVGLAIVVGFIAFATLMPILEAGSVL